MTLFHESQADAGPAPNFSFNLASSIILNLKTAAVAGKTLLTPFCCNDVFIYLLNH